MKKVVYSGSEDPRPEEGEEERKKCFLRKQGKRRKAKYGGRGLVIKRFAESPK